MTMQQEIFPLSMFDNIKAHPENYRLLEKIPLTIEGVDTHFPIRLNDIKEGEKVYSVVFLDTETTGIDVSKCKIIELGMVKATFSLDRKILLSVDRYYDEFEDPQEPIPENIVALTHITDEMVAGKRFDDEMVANFLSGRPLVVAHNAAFDRPFFEKRFATLTNLSWACSFKEVPWSDLGFPGSKLEYLNMHLGYFYSAHRAYVDCLALLWIMYIRSDAFMMLVKSAMTPNCKIVVKGYTFNINNDLKRMEFRFEGASKSWVRFVGDKEKALQIKDTLENTFKDGETNFTVDIVELTARTRYKSRI
ncbi:MAG: 3'-5' exonuclease [Succinivibrio sp.]